LYNGLIRESKRRQKMLFNSLEQKALQEWADDHGFYVIPEDDEDDEFEDDEDDFLDEDLEE
jgi:hypothetical protein